MKANEHGLIELENGVKIYEEEKCIETISSLKNRLIDIDSDLIYALTEVDRLKDERMDIKDAIERWEKQLESTQIETFKNRLNLYADLTGATQETKQAIKKEKKKPTTK